MISTDISIDFLKRLRSTPSWPQVGYAFDNQIIPVRTVIAFAQESVDGESNPEPAETAIATASANDSIASFVHELAERECDSNEAAARTYWANVVLAWAYERRSGFSDFLGFVEEIYATFDYPEDLAPFVRYMPTERPNLGSRKANEDRLMTLIGEFVQQIIRD